MEKRKWLWKRRSSDKSPCETESSGSISSHSERYSDDQEAPKGSPDHNTQSPEVSSKVVAITENANESSLKKEDINDSVKSLTDRLSAALVNVSAKEDLVKQHAKVAEEAVAGWEKAENEVAILKQQLEAAVQQNSALEDRVSHLDGALKECVRQLRQAREEQEQKIQEAVSRKAQEWESTKCKLENQFLELRNKAEANKAEFSDHVDPDICIKLEYLESENSALKLEIQAQMEELEVRTIERDLSTQAAETASKQHLESIKKVAKLEAECRRLKAMACKSSFGNDHRSTTASSTYLESFTDSHSDNGERLNAVDINMQKINSVESNKCELNLSDSWASALIAELHQFKNEKTVNTTSSVEINLMDDFLEMERLAALQPNESRSSCLESEVVPNESKNGESVLRTELEAMTHQKAELEEKLEKLEAENAELTTALTKTHNSIEASQLQLMEAEMKLELQTDRESVLRTELEAMIHRKGELEEKLKKLETEKAQLEAALTKSQSKIEVSQHHLMEAEMKLELQVDGESVLRTKLETMICQTAELQEKLEKLETEKAELEMAWTKSQGSVEASQHQLMEAEMKLEELQGELNVAKESKQMIESQLVSLEAETLTMSAKVNHLEEEVQRERALSAGIAVKCQDLEKQLLREKEEIKLRETAVSNGEAKIKQEGLAVAAGKLAECQKTIASLGNQLKNLATLEDFLIDAANLPDFNAAASLIPKAGDQWKLHSNHTFSPKRDSDSSKVVDESCVPSPTTNHENPSPPSSSSSSSSSLTSAMVLSTHVSSEKNRNGFAKFFSRTKSGIRLEI